MVVDVVAVCVVVRPDLAPLVNDFTSHLFDLCDTFRANSDWRSGIVTIMGRPQKEIHRIALISLSWP